MIAHRRHRVRRGRGAGPLLTLHLLLVLLLLAVATPATAKPGGPPTPVGPGNGPSQISVAQYPAGTGFLFGTYDYSGSWEDDIWSFGSPVSLIVLSHQAMNATNVENTLRRDLGFDAAAPASEGEGGLAVAYDSLADPSRMSTWCGFPPGQRKLLTAGDGDSFMHVRVYAYNGSWWHRTSGDPYMVVATGHVDVNETMGDTTPASVPRGFRGPRYQKYTYYRFSGNSEFVEHHVAGLWAAKYGADHVVVDAVPLGNAENAFTVTRETEYPDPPGGCIAYGTWWKSDGYATVLWWP
jgi:hypothetical protein